MILYTRRLKEKNNQIHFFNKPKKTKKPKEPNYMYILNFKT